MKTLLFSFVIAFCSFGMQAQTDTNTVDVDLGDSFTIGAPADNSYQHIDVPRANLIRKRGGMFNLDAFKGLVVEVTDIKDQKDGRRQVTIQPKDGGRFFGSHRYLTADLNGSLQSGELIAP
ncbi:MAG: hypothetical protein ACSHXF_10405 [Aquaticitalea sp.]